MSTKKKDARLPHDTANMPIQVAGTIREHDAAASAVVSPVTVASGIQTITVPELALVLVLKCDKAFRYGTNATLDGSAAGKGYKKAAADTDVRIPCATADAIYVKPDSYSAEIDFFFEMI